MNGQHHIELKREKTEKRNTSFSIRFLMTVVCIIAVIMVTVYFIGAQCRPASDTTDAMSAMSAESIADLPDELEAYDEADGEHPVEDDVEESAETEYSVYIPIDYNIPGQKITNRNNIPPIPPGLAAGKLVGEIDPNDLLGDGFIEPQKAGDALYITHTHSWTQRTCTEPAVCEICGAEGLPAFGHDWAGATCKDPAVCRRCGISGDKSDIHKWADATCTEPKTCTVCGKTEGEPLGHKWKDATCLAPKTCTRCGKTTGKTASHDWEDATCTKPKTCSVCGTTKGEALGHKWSAATCTKPKTCKRCGKESGDALGHEWAPATKTSPSKCKICGITKGSRLPNPIKVAAYKYTDEELELFARILYIEGGTKRESLMAVGAVIMNRVRHSGYGDTVKEVIMAPNQFATSGLYRKDPPDICYEVAKICMGGELYDSDVRYFKMASGDTKWGSRKYQFTVGGNYFYT